MEIMDGWLLALRPSFPNWYQEDCRMIMIDCVLLYPHLLVVGISVFSGNRTWTASFAGQCLNNLAIGAPLHKKKSEKRFLSFCMYKHWKQILRLSSLSLTIFRDRLIYLSRIDTKHLYRQWQRKVIVLYLSLTPITHFFDKNSIWSQTAKVNVCRILISLKTKTK